MCHSLSKFKYQLIVLLCFSVLSPGFYAAEVDSDTIACPDGYALEMSPGVYVRCEDYDLYFDSNESTEYEMKFNREDE